MSCGSGWRLSSGACRRASWGTPQTALPTSAHSRSRSTLEHQAVAQPATRRAAEPPPPGIGVPAGGSARGPAIIVDELEQASAGEPAAVESSEPQDMEIEIRDQRVRPGPSAWIAAIGHRLDEFRRDPRPFSVLLIEPLHPAAMGELSGAGELADRIERVLAAELSSRASERPRAAAELITREAPGRWWVLSSEPDRAAAEVLALRLARAGAEVRGALGDPVELAVGTAVCPADGSEPSALAAHADVGLYAARAAARAAGRRIATGAEEIG